MRNRMQELKNWDDIRLLKVMIDRLRQWHRAGLLCLGDAAHAMSPVGGVGINLAIQDAVAAANLLVEPLRRGAPSIDDLGAVQRRRTFPTRMTQRMQLFIQNRVLTGALTRTPRSLPLALRLLRRWPALRRIPACVIGIGFRPEHVKTPDAYRAS